MSQNNLFDKEFFDRELGEKPPDEPIKSYSPLRLDLPRSTAYEIIQMSNKGKPCFYPPGVVRYLRSQLIVYDGYTPRQFDGRVYTVISEHVIINMIYDAVIESGIDYVPTPSNINHILTAIRSMLRMTYIQFPEPEMAEDYETYGEGQLIAFENGVLNTALKRFCPFTPYIYLTSYLRAVYDPSKAHSTACSVLEGIVPSQETLDFLYEMMGFFFFDDRMYPPAIFNLYGPGNTGKSAIAHMISEIMGRGTVSQMGIHQLTARFTMAELEGKRLNICGETDDTSSRETRVDGALLKRLTDGDVVLVEKKGKDPYEIRNTAKFLFVTNSIPDFGDNSSGMYRRLYVIPCRVQQDKKAAIYDKLTDPESRSWIINKSLEAYNRFLERGNQFVISPQMEYELEQFKSQDSVLDFIQATFGTTDPVAVGHKIIEDETLCWTVEIYEAYLGYTKNAMSKPVSRKKFIERLRNEYSLKTKTVGFNAGDRWTTRYRYYL